MSQYRVVCAAIRDPETDLVICGVRHFDPVMGRMCDFVEEHSLTHTQFSSWEQGFIDNRRNFLTRSEAWKMAQEAGQIILRVGGDTYDGGTLYSENLY